MRLVTLTTDFGTRDEYVGVMKGVIAGIAPMLRVLDITHGIDPQDVAHGAYVLAAACGYYPPGTVHVAVVDPGVGGERRILAVAAGEYRFVAPDNGLLERVLACRSIHAVVSVENRRFFREPVSRTFHGRDIFAPVAAHLAAGVPIGEFGPRVAPQTMVSGVIPCCRPVGGDCIEGTVLAVDRFGNLLTTIDGETIASLARGGEHRRVTVAVAGRSIGSLVDAYDRVARHAPLAIIGSRGLLEISVNCGDAGKALGVTKNAAVRVYRV